MKERSGEDRSYQDVDRCEQVQLQPARGARSAEQIIQSASTFPGNPSSTHPLTGTAPPQERGTRGEGTATECTGKGGTLR